MSVQPQKRTRRAAEFARPFAPAKVDDPVEADVVTSAGRIFAAQPVLTCAVTTT
ncbi:MAG: hypothetical protein WB777_27320 [Mycobacterium sp.]